MEFDSVVILVELVFEGLVDLVVIIFVSKGFVFKYLNVVGNVIVNGWVVKLYIV